MLLLPPLLIHEGEFLLLEVQPGDLGPEEEANLLCSLVHEDTWSHSETLVFTYNQCLKSIATPWTVLLSLLLIYTIISLIFVFHLQGKGYYFSIALVAAHKITPSAS